MFKRIVSSLSLSPAAAGELAFYARRLKAEGVTRTFSMIAAVLVVGLQFAVILAPPTASNAASSNDIVYGGIVSKDDLLNRYDTSTELKALYARFGISRADIQAASTVTIKSSDTSLHSIGRNRHWADDTEIVAAGTTYYGRVLHKWDSGASSSYKVLQGTRSSDGGYFAVMYACGNIIYKTIPAVPAPTSTPTPTPSVKPAPVVTPTPIPKATPVPATIAPTPTSTMTPRPVVATTTPAATPVPTPVATPVVTTSTPTSTPSSRPSVTPAATATPAPVVTPKPTPTPPAPPAAFDRSKQAFNVTRNVDATTVLARGGDVIRYRLLTTNTGGTATGYSVVEHLEDVIEYADITEPGGGTITDCVAGSPTCVLTWPATVVAPGETLAREFTVTVKNPIPTTAVSASDKYSYDLRMDNLYGTSSVQINLEAPSPKQVELASARLPQTGTGTASLIMLTVAALSAYLYVRNRQLLREVHMLKGDFNGGHHL